MFHGRRETGSHQLPVLALFSPIGAAGTVWDSGAGGRITRGGWINFCDVILEPRVCCGGDAVENSELAEQPGTVLG